MEQIGTVILVGAGPGDPGLLTLRGKHALESADVVLYDRLVGSEILDMIPATAEAVDVGKSSGRHLLPQEEINRLILDRARQGKRVVRLKGGDPFLFGRGAEELEEVVRLGIPFEVVPGITSAIAVPSAAGIPVTHRNMASSVHIVTGHPRHGVEPSIHYESLVRLGGTLVFLMGVGALDSLTAGLLDAGMAPHTPAALVENGTRPNQRKLLGTVGTIASQARSAEFHPPSVLVVGDVCALSPALDRTASGPLAGARVLVTRPRASAGTLVSLLRERGCQVIEYPCIRTEPLPVDDGVYERLAGFGWIVFTSPVGAQRFFDVLATRRTDMRTLAGMRFAAVGPKTAGVLESRGIYPDLVPQSYHGEALAEALCIQCRADERVLLYRARDGAPALAAALRQRGLEVDDVAAYATLYESPNADLVGQALGDGAIDFVTFTSASTVRGYAESLPGSDLGRVTGVCIGEETAAAARKLGIPVVVCEKATVESLVDRVIDAYACSKKGSE